MYASVSTGTEAWKILDVSGITFYLLDCEESWGGGIPEGTAGVAAFTNWYGNILMF